VNRSTRLGPFARLANQRQQGAARSLHESQEELARYRQRLQELRTYRAEYCGRFQDIAKTGSSAEHIKRFVNFIAKIDDGIRQLESLIGLAQGRCEQHREEWLAARSRFRALDEVITRYRSDEAADSLRREQRESDERGQRGSPANP
jgi:flagellar FliJ protein